jgi:hypothetical protein
MFSSVRYAGQALFYALFAAAIGGFASWPVYHQVPENTARIKLSFNHGGARLEDCHKLTSEELAKLPTNKRKPSNCSRERQPILIQLWLDGTPLYEATLKPGGLSSDGQAQTYEKFIVPTGRHVILARLRDSKRTEG